MANHKQYTYNKSIDSKVVKAVEGVLKTSVIYSKRINEGIVNHVYKIITTKGVFIAKVFRNRYWPEDGKLDWIEKQMRKHKVPHAKVLYYSRDNKYFPYGFMISEFVQGLSGWAAIEKGKHTLFESWKESGKLLKKVHDIKGQGFGQVKNGKGIESSFVKYEIRRSNEKLEELIKLRKVDRDTSQAIVSKAQAILEPFDKRFRPVLIHGDASRDNSILSDTGEFILIDWDNAKLGISLWDYFWLTTWMPLMPKWKDPAKRAKASKAFFEGYGNIGFTQQEIKQIEPGVHLLIYVGLLLFYAERKEAYYFNRFLKLARNIAKS